MEQSLILTSKKSFVDWGDIFSDAVLATAILDRMPHRSTTINIKGESYRLKTKLDGMQIRDVSRNSGGRSPVLLRNWIVTRQKTYQEGRCRQRQGAMHRVSGPASWERSHPI